MTWSCCGQPAVWHFWGFCVLASLEVLRAGEFGGFAVLNDSAYDQSVHISLGDRTVNLAQMWGGVSGGYPCQTIQQL